MVDQNLNEKLEKYEALRQTLYAILVQKQKIKQQYDEIENALKELENYPKDKPIFKMVGNIMISKTKDLLVNELKEKKEFLEVRLQSLDKQEKTLKESLEKLQKELENIMKTAGLKSDNQSL